MQEAEILVACQQHNDSSFHTFTAIINNMTAQQEAQAGLEKGMQFEFVGIKGDCVFSSVDSNSSFHSTNYSI